MPVFLEIELEQGVGMNGALGKQGAKVFEQHYLRIDGQAVIVAQVELTQGGGGCVAHPAGAGGLPLQRPVMQNGAAVIGMNNEIDLDACTEPHRLDDTLAGKDWIVSAAAEAR